MHPPRSNYPIPRPTTQLRPFGQIPATSRFSTPGVCVAIAVFLCVFEGGVRKWGFPNSSASVQAIMYFSKDVPLALAGLLSLRVTGRASIRRPIRNLLTICTALILLGSLIPLDGLAPIGSVIVIRSIVYLPWLAFVIGPALKGRRDLELILHTIGLCVAINAGLGSVQFFLPPTHVLNRMVSDQQEAIFDVGRVRAPGTFAYISGMADLCALGCWAGSVLIVNSPVRPFGYVYVVAGVACAMAAMSRHGLAEGAFVVGLTMVCTKSGRVAGVSVGILLALALALSAVQGEGEQETIDIKRPTDLGLADAVMVRHERADSFSERLILFYGQVPKALANFPTGVGLGASQTAEKVANEGMGMVFEFDLARICFEIGVAGFLGALLFRAGFPVIVWLSMPRREPPPDRIGRAVWWPTLWMTALMPNMMIGSNHVLSTFLATVMICLYAAAEREVVPWGRR